MKALLAFAAFSSMAGNAAAQNPEAIYAFETLGSSCLGPLPCIVVIDPSSGQPTYSTKMLYPPVPFRLTHDGTRLLGISSRPGQPGEELFQYHLATGQVLPIGLVGWSWDSVNLAHNPQDGFLYSIATLQSQTISNLYRIDPKTGAATLLFPVTGAATTGAAGFAIDSMGVGYIGCLVPGGVCTIDLASGSTNFLGSLPLNGFFSDLAFDGNGTLWAAVYGGTGTESGLYKIDPAMLAATKVGTGQFDFNAMAIGPSCAPTSYCTGKVNSLGCLPTIEGVGYPAPSAAYGFKVIAKNLRNNRFGLLIVSTNGRTALPFLGGTLCIAPPISRVASSSSGGSHPPTQDCSGVWVADFNTYLFGPNPPRSLMRRDAKFPPAGTQYNVQWWGRDVFGNAALTPGLEFTLCP